MDRKMIIVSALFIIFMSMPAFFKPAAHADSVAEPSRGAAAVELENSAPGPVDSSSASPPAGSTPVEVAVPAATESKAQADPGAKAEVGAGSSSDSSAAGVPVQEAATGEVKAAPGVSPAPAEPVSSVPAAQASAPVSAEVSLARPIAVMVENEPPARPQSGLYAAKVLFEIQAEEVTRFMGVYYDLSQSFEIGPIRSARHYFVDISTMFDAVYVHVGGSPMGLAEIAERKINNINAIKGDRGFYRSSDRRIPHNLYAKLPNLKKEMERKKYRTETDKRMPFEFADSKLTSAQLSEKGSPGVAVKSVQIPYSRGYRVGYEFDASENRFGRLYNDRPFRDLRNSTQVKADNVVIMRCNMRIIDAQMRHEMDLYEGGTCEIFIGGHHVSGSWDRDRASGVFKYYDSGLNDVKFNPGNVIVHVIAPDQPVIIDGRTFVCEKNRGSVKNKGEKKAARGSVEQDEPEDDSRPPF